MNFRKSIDLLTKEAEESGEGTLKRTLGPVNLVALGIGAIIGAGLFSITGSAAANNAGPAITISFIIAAVGCAFAGLCYAEFASIILLLVVRIPILMPPWASLWHGSLAGIWY
ncbi:hypothetical protein [Pedobacter sp. UC225_65]|uniref:hypothetical protein n=1 Tax=Pedobacter sp. UC225_65 TaxID=3350173 RepID=UPI00366C6CEB